MFPLWNHKGRTYGMAEPFQLSAASCTCTAEADGAAVADQGDGLHRNRHYRRNDQWRSTIAQSKFIAEARDRVQWRLQHIDPENA